MDIVSTAIDAAVLAGVGFLLWVQTRGLRREMDRRFDQVDRRFDRLEARLDSNVEGLRSDIVKVALAVGAGPSAEAST